MRKRPEDLGDELNDFADIEFDEEDLGIDDPFDPSQIRITTKPILIEQLLQRIKFEEIDLAPHFQRHAGIWSKEAKSRLIESILIRMPLPTLFFDATDDDRWEVVDGLQRLTVLKEFALEKTMRLDGLEFLQQFEGMSFDELPRGYQRRIGETTLTASLIERPTPHEVKFVLFRRINTGGLPLNAQEIRHALNPGPVLKFLAGLAESEPFLAATGGSISRGRMTDRECVLRVLAFMITPYRDYKASEFNAFLNDIMKALNARTVSELSALGSRFSTAMQTAFAIFGQDAFRKQTPGMMRRGPINKALLEAWGANLAMLSNNHRQSLITAGAQVKTLLTELLQTPEFVASISTGTGKAAMIRTRFAAIERLIGEVLSR